MIVIAKRYCHVGFKRVLENGKQGVVLYNAAKVIKIAAVFRMSTKIAKNMIKVYQKMLKMAFLSMEKNRKLVLTSLWFMQFAIMKVTTKIEME